MAEQYPEATSKLVENTESLLKIFSVTYGVAFYFLPYDFKMTESLTPNWNSQTVFGRMDPIMTFKSMPRTIQLQFKARQKLEDSNKPDMRFNGDELLHSIDHLKKCLYPRYNNNEIMISPPLFRFQYKNLINAGPNQFDIGPDKGVLGAITAFSANFMTDINKIYFPSNPKKQMAYPKVFDINITFQVLNEQLVETQQTNILNEQFFYKYEHGHFHSETPPDVPEQNASNGTGTSPSADAGAAIVTQGTV